MSRVRSFLILGLLALATVGPTFAFGPAWAGDMDDPDMTDATGDATSGKAARDLVAGWVGNETESLIEFDLQMPSLEMWAPYSDWQSFPIVYYEFFFDVTTPTDSVSYAVVAMVPVYHAGAAFVSFELRQVTYSSSGNVENYTTVNSENGDYGFRTGVIALFVDKAFIGTPGRGDVIENIWARVTSTSGRGSGDLATEDVMMSHIVPGRSLPLTGGVTYFSVGLGANITNATTTPEGPVSFEVTIHSDSEAQANVSLRAATLLPANWTLRTDRALYYILPGETQSASVTITPAANTSNGTRRITIIGDYKDEPGANRTTENTITFSIVIQGGAPPPGEGPGPSGPATISPYVLYAGLGAAAVVGAVLWFVVWPLLHASRARDRFNRVSQSSWARSPRRGPSGGAPRPMLRAPGMAPGQPPSGAPRPPLR